MGLPAYYTEDSSPASPIPLPVSWDPLSNPYAVTREETKLQTGRGIVFEYEISTRRTPVYIFTVPASLLQDFKDMHDAVVGSAFYFIPDTDATESPLTALHVRKDPSFLPEPIGVFFYEGVAEQFFKYTLNLYEEITAADIDD